MIRNIILIAMLVIIYGCAHTNMYVAKKDSEPHGYYEEQTDKNTYLVTYETYKPIEIEESFNYVLKRSAELAKANGFTSFELISNSEETVTELLEVPEVIGIVSQQNDPSGTTNMGAQTGVIVPAYTRAYTIKKSHAKIEFSNSGLGPNVYLVKELIEN